MLKRTTIAIDEGLLAEAKVVTGISMTKELVIYALQELVRREGQLDALSLKDKVIWDGKLDEMRRVRNI